jgi:hypothetical protein
MPVDLRERTPSDCQAGRLRPLRPPSGNRFANIASHILSVGSSLKKSRIEETFEECSTSPPIEHPQSQHLFKGQPQSWHFTIFRPDPIDVLVKRIPETRLLGHVRPLLRDHFILQVLEADQDFAIRDSTLATTRLQLAR